MWSYTCHFQWQEEWNKHWWFAIKDYRISESADEKEIEVPSDSDLEWENESVTGRVSVITFPFNITLLLKMIRRVSTLGIYKPSQFFDDTQFKYLIFRLITCSMLYVAKSTQLIVKVILRKSFGVFMREFNWSRFHRLLLLVEPKLEKKVLTSLQ